jgi:hypothetical protein
MKGGALRESAIIEGILKRAKATPGLVLRKRHVTMGVTGDPDLYGSYWGEHVEIECKRPGEKPTPLQLQRLRQWRDAGAVTGWTTSVEGAFRLLRRAGRRA